MKNPNRTIALLVAVHVIVGLVFAGLTGARQVWLPTSLWAGLMFSQMSLLGFWGGLGTNRWWVRLLGVISGILFLSLLLAWTVSNAWMASSIVFAIIICIVIGLIPVRRMLARLRWDNENSIYANNEDIQFTIRQLMMLTFVIAVMLSLGKWLFPFFFPVGVDMPLTALLAMGTYCLCFATTALTSVWAVMGRSNSIARCVLALIIAVALGCVMAQCFQGAKNRSLWITTMFADATFLLASLWVVRRCGYRLVRISRVQVAPPIAETPPT